MSVSGMNDPLTPPCAIEHLDRDPAAQRWIVEQIRRLPPGWWQRASQRYEEEFLAPLEGDSKHHPTNRRLYRANSWLREAVKTYVDDNGIRRIPNGSE